MDRFNEENFDVLGYYVYRLVDPRDNKTFYVGKGCGNRVFNHVNDELRFSNSVDENDSNESELSEKNTNYSRHSQCKSQSQTLHPSLWVE